MLHKANVALLG